MRIFLRVLLIAGAAAMVPLAVWLYDRATRDTKPPVPAATKPAATKPAATNPAPSTNPVAPTTTPPAPKSIGAAGCAAGGCHGSPASGSMSPDIWLSSSDHWTRFDPHNKAYAALKTDLAKHIMTGLKDPNTDATQAARCLACHTNPASAADPVKRSEGMNCESCHGNSDKWFQAHTAFGTRARHEAYESVGMLKLFDLGTRAEVCAGCHIGAPADASRGLPLRDMNHDMIAAGHPRLNFDLADHQRRLNPHWFEKDRTAANPRTPAGPAFEVKAWLVGRVAAAEAACVLTADRASRDAPWPEFAEMNCFACHHEFEPKGWRQSTARRTPARKPGMAAWQTVWPVTRADDFARIGSDANHDVVALVSLMERSRSPNPSLASAGATITAKKLRGVRETLSRLPEKDAGKVARGVFLALPPERADVLDWDEARQVYFGLAALDASRVKVGGTPDPLLAKFADHLRLPRTPDGSGFDSPRGYDPAAGRDLLRECLKSVPARADVIER